MANEDQLRILRQGVDAWNKWRTENPEREICLSGANLKRANLRRRNLVGANLNGADLRGVNLYKANLSVADLREAKLRRANLREADLSMAILTDVNLIRADLSNTNFSNANLSKANLSCSIMVETNFEGAILTSCGVYGISAWGLKLKGATQKDLIITPEKEPLITVDNLEVAQFVYLLLHNEKIRYVIDTITSKVVLILGRFTKERKAVLDAIREELRWNNYLPVLFDFEKPASFDLTETISTLAHIARFIIADVTDAKSIPAELEHIVPQLPSVPVMPLMLSSDFEYALFEHIRRYPWVLEPYRYENQEHLLATIEEKVIAPAEAKVKEIRKPG